MENISTPIILPSTSIKIGIVLFNEMMASIWIKIEILFIVEILLL